jgi:hypothetical protein
MDEKRCGEYLRLVFRRGMRALLCKVAYAGRTNEPEHGRAVVQHGMTKLMSQSHSIPTDTHPCAITNTTFARNRHNALGELGFGINASSVRASRYALID